jgi:hypothetical protein
MSVRRRKWKTGKGVEREAWIVDYVDQGGVRRLKTFDRKKEADAFAASATVEVGQGTHVADSATCTVAEAGERWIDSCQAAGLERTTVAQYRQHLDLHIKNDPIARALLSRVSVPAVREFEDRLRAAGRSTAMVKRIRGSLGALLGDAQERGLVNRNAVREVVRWAQAGERATLRASSEAKGANRCGYPDTG